MPPALVFSFRARLVANAPILDIDRDAAAAYSPPLTVFTVMEYSRDGGADDGNGASGNSGANGRITIRSGTGSTMAGYPGYGYRCRDVGYRCFGYRCRCHRDGD